jgi:hypothetical protein
MTGVGCGLVVGGAPADAVAFNPVWVLGLLAFKLNDQFHKVIENQLDISPELISEWGG